jgi:hypothetical protein
VRRAGGCRNCAARRPACVSVHIAAACDQESADREEEIDPKEAGGPARTVSVARYQMTDRIAMARRPLRKPNIFVFAKRAYSFPRDVPTVRRGTSRSSWSSTTPGRPGERDDAPTRVASPRLRASACALRPLFAQRLAERDAAIDATSP